MISQPDGTYVLIHPLTESLILMQTVNNIEWIIRNVLTVHPDSYNAIIQEGRSYSKSIDENTDLKDTKTWPVPPTEKVYGEKKKVKEGAPTREKPRKRGEKSYYDEEGGEWRPVKPDKYHEEHWDYKPPVTNENPYPAWQNIKP